MHRKIYIISLLIITASVIVSCSSLGMFNHSDKQVQSLYGEWKTTCADNINDIRLIFLENGEYYKFSRFVGGELLEKGSVFNSDTIVFGGQSQHKASYKINDENLFLKEPGIYSLRDYVYTKFKKIDSEKYRITLNSYLIQDSIRNILIGWWKLDTSLSKYDSIHYMFYPGKTSFTINVEDDGTATIFGNNKFNSSSKYTYRMTNNGVQLLEKGGCMVSNHSIIRIDSSSLILTWRRNDDTLHFNRLIEIK